MKLSIITINYNNIEGLRRTMDSVFAQTCRDFEYIVIDGASTDGSAEYIWEHADKLTYWVSEKDTGIYNAMNKGVRAAQGEYVLMLNSGDYLVNECVVEKVLPELIDADIVQGNTIDDDIRNRGYGKSEINFLDVYQAKFLHQGSFCKRILFEKYGYFDENYRFVSDTKFFIITLGYAGCSYKYVDIDIAYFDLTGISCSTDPKVLKMHKEEEARLRHDVYPGRLYEYCQESSRKVLLYDELRFHKLLWYFIMFCKKYIW